jgi:TatD DNase family protein
MVDSHCHLADDAFVGDLDLVVARAAQAGLTTALCILSANEPAELAQAARVKAAWPGVRFATAIHPHHAGAYAGQLDEATAVVRAAVGAVDAVAVGEIGLDYHYDYAPRDVQQGVFAAQVALAVELGRPVVIHMREATADTFAVLHEAGRGQVRGVMHCFSHGETELRLALELGFFVSLAGILTFPKSARLREVARLIPLDRVLVETDAPFLAPVPHRGQRNEPAWVLDTLRQLAAIHGLAPEALGAQVVANFATLVGRA